MTFICQQVIWKKKILYHFTWPSYGILKSFMRNFIENLFFVNISKTIGSIEFGIAPFLFLHVFIHILHKAGLFYYIIIYNHFWNVILVILFLAVRSQKWLSGGEIKFDDPLASNRLRHRVSRSFFYKKRLFFLGSEVIYLLSI